MIYKTKKKIIKKKYLQQNDLYELWSCMFTTRGESESLVKLYVYLDILRSIKPKLQSQALRYPFGVSSYN